MISQFYFYFLTILLCLINPLSVIQVNAQSQRIKIPTYSITKEAQEVCPLPALSRLQRHTIAPGETIKTIAEQYNLISPTLLAFNQVLRQGQVAVGTEIVIPPYNGIAIKVPIGKTWKSVAENYNIRADTLYEVNGCPETLEQQTPKIVFLPGVNWSPGGKTPPKISSLTGYPLPFEARVILGYGWLLHPIKNKVIFHSGLDLIADSGTSVFSVGEGIVAFAGKQSNYGNLVVINHAAGKQTRYAHLDSIQVKTGQKVGHTELLGTVGQTGEPDFEEAHLHFEIRYNSPLGWVAENPNSYIEVIFK
ncbi:MAG: M23 family metallopeptidase [Trichodesmium sp. St15_bin1_1]|jgi:Membrane proteins related to metalloendopeptidases|nr:M23 family metallopeptidase [Trichodesmium sp. St18_bin1]MDE5089316.1 M23 family metallopeptidase [Trichodesmium sp. St16_bin2-tuft]MDE5112680.1 M23 family metallopeptidase [Trichodesmium sp. St7_bin2_1]MDE5114530.1 M23 family metallopeptidase [Trichodesmium sp. St15_bin1_1]